MPRFALIPMLLLCGLSLASCAGQDGPPPEGPAVLDPMEQGQSCRPQVDQQLASLDVAQDDVESVTFRRRESTLFMRGMRRRLIQGFNAWVRPKDIAGYLVIELSTNCTVQQAYTRGNYVLAGVAHH